MNITNIVNFSKVLYFVHLCFSHFTETSHNTITTKMFTFTLWILEMFNMYRCFQILKHFSNDENAWPNIFGREVFWNIFDNDSNVIL